MASEKIWNWIQLTSRRLPMEWYIGLDGLFWKNRKYIGRIAENSGSHLLGLTSTSRMDILLLIGVSRCTDKNLPSPGRRFSLLVS